MGLITKAIKKVEIDESPAARQKTASEAKKKKRLLIAGAALLVIGICLGAGYLFLLQPSVGS